MHSEELRPVIGAHEFVLPYGADRALVPSIMKKRIAEPEPQEPLGIIISRGSREDLPPRFAAYVWGPGPETVSDLKDLVAA